MLALDVRLYHDRSGNRDWAHDEKEPGRSLFCLSANRNGCPVGGWINAIIPVLIVPYYSVIGGWVIKYLVEYIKGNGQQLAADGYFSDFISNGASTEICFVGICAVYAWRSFMRVCSNGIERVSKFMMPVLIVLSVIIAIYSVTRPGALEGVKYFLVPNVKNFSWMTVVAAMGQMFYSLSIAMGILITFGSYMKKDVSIEDSTRNVEMFRYGHRNHGGTDDHSGSICFFRRRSRDVAGGSCADVYYDSESICQAWDLEQ